MTDDRQIPFGGRDEPELGLTDDELLDALRTVTREDEPLPALAVEFAQGAWAWRKVDAELAELLHDSHDAATVVVRNTTSVRIVMFRAGAVTLEAEHGAEELFGAVTPAGSYRVDVHDGAKPRSDPPVASVTTDDAGLFRIAGGLAGTLRFVVVEGGDRVVLVSPWVTC